MKRRFFSTIMCAVLILTIPHIQFSQTGRLPKTPLAQKTLNLLANEVSGQIIYNNLAILAGAPWIREEKEFSDTLYEAQKIYDMVKNFGIDTVRLDRFSSERKIHYAFEGEFRTVKPKKKLIARLDADTAMIARGSSSVDITSELIYLPPLKAKDIKEWTNRGIQEKYKGKIALMWARPVFGQPQTARTWFWSHCSTSSTP